MNAHVKNITLFCLTTFGIGLFSAGVLTPVDSKLQPVETVQHEVFVTINNGFSMTEVIQTFYNPNDREVEAIFSFPVPESACLSEMTIYTGEMELNGEVLAKDEAEKAFEDEKNNGNDTGLAKKDENQNFQFHISPVAPFGETRIRYVYYQPGEIDANIGRYVYPLEDGGTDERAKSFWTKSETVQGTFSFELVLKSSWPIEDVRMPGFEQSLNIQKDEQGCFKVRLEQDDLTLNRDLVFYYRLAEDLPGSVELMTYKPRADQDGTFMMIVTPGLDLQPLTQGVDYVFVLDLSGSMSGKIQTLAKGVIGSLNELNNLDRFRIIGFSTSAREILSWRNVTEENVQSAGKAISKLQPGGSTNIYEGLEKSFEDLNTDRATRILLITDGVTNTGIVEPKSFHKLCNRYDVRVFGFLLGNNANWPLMRTITQGTGGFYQSISNADDMIGQIIQAKDKLAFECLHDATLTIKGVVVHQVTNQTIGKIYRGQQLVFFGSYEDGGHAEILLNARMTGEDKTYRTSFDFPEQSDLHPELERLWAIAQIEQWEDLVNAGLQEPQESDQEIERIGIAYQIVTDQTSMVVMSDDSFHRQGIQRRNQKRIKNERTARAKRTVVKSTRVDQKKPMFQHPRPSAGSGSIDWLTGGLMLLFGCLLGLVHPGTKG